MPSRKPSLTPKRKVFCREYIVDKDATKAAIRAKFSQKTAGQIGYQLLQITSIKAEIARLMAEQEKRQDISADRILRALLNIAEFDLSSCYDEDGNLKPIHDWPEAAKKTVTGIKVFEEFEFDPATKKRVKIGETREIKTEGRVSALTLLGKHLKLFVETLDLRHHNMGRRSLTDEELEAAWKKRQNQHSKK